MSLERLTYFVDAVDLASFTAAAQKISFRKLPLVNK